MIELEGKKYTEQPSVVLCSCKRQMSVAASPFEGHDVWICSCGRSHIEQQNPLEKAMKGMAEMLRANGIDIGGIAP